MELKSKKFLSTRMESIEKANALRTWWVGYSPKYGIKHKTYFPPGRTDSECEESFKEQLKAIDLAYKKKLEKERWQRTEEYARSKLAKYKQKAIDELKKELQQRHQNNNSRFMGGYTGPAIMDHKAEVERIRVYEEQQMIRINKEFDGSPECLKRVAEIARKDDKEYEEAVRRNQMMPGGGGHGLHPQVGGAAGYHAAVHGGGFNHPGVYAGGVWS